MHNLPVSNADSSKNAVESYDNNERNPCESANACNRRQQPKRKFRGDVRFVGLCDTSEEEEKGRATSDVDLEEICSSSSTEDADDDVDDGSADEEIVPSNKTTSLGSHAGIKKTATTATDNNIIKKSKLCHTSVNANWDDQFATVSAMLHEQSKTGTPLTQDASQWLLGAKFQAAYGKLSSEHLMKLQALVNDGFLVMDDRGISWNSHYDRLLEYEAMHGHCNVPELYAGLGKWLVHQRCDRRQGKLTPEREAKLKQLVDEGKMFWDIDNAGTWNTQYAQLLEYGAMHGHCNVSAQCSGLGNWLKIQRCERRRSELTPEREAKLQQLVDEGKLFWDFKK